MMHEDTLNNEVFEEAIELDDEALEDVAGGKMFKSTTFTYVFEHAHPNSKKIGILKEGVTVPCSSGTYSDGRNKWYRVKYKGITGYVIAKHGHLVD